MGLAEGGVPIGAVLFDGDGNLLGRGHNRRVQEDDPSIHGETDAFRKAGRQRSYRDTIMVTTLAAPRGRGSRVIAKVGHRGSGESKKCTGKLEVMPPSENHTSSATSSISGHSNGRPS